MVKTLVTVAAAVALMVNATVIEPVCFSVSSSVASKIWCDTDTAAATIV
jgi:hypothetical protein